jgi:hypothetical protein
MSLKSSLEQLAEIAVKRDEVHFGFIKQILLMASALLGILVSLHKSNTVDYIVSFIFAIALSLLSLGLLLLAIALSAQVAVQKDQFLKWKAEVIKQLNDDNYRPKSIFGEPSKIYAVCEKIGYISISFSIMFLTVYAVLIA